MFTKTDINSVIDLKVSLEIDIQEPISIDGIPDYTDIFATKANLPVGHILPSPHEFDFNNVVTPYIISPFHEYFEEAKIFYKDLYDPDI